jgi:hypothetical protein
VDVTLANPPAGTTQLLTALTTFCNAIKNSGMTILNEYGSLRTASTDTAYPAFISSCGAIQTYATTTGNNLHIK